MVEYISKNYDVVICAALLSFFFLLLTRWLAIKVSLLDIPNKRKFHYNQIPLTGGISVFISIFLTSFIFFETISIDLCNFLIFGGCMLVLGVIDDKWDLPSSKKLFFQSLIVLTFVIVTDYKINDLGTPLGFSSSLKLGLLSVPFTLFAVVGLKNAFNMIDGCDGLASTLVIISSLALLIFNTTGFNNSNEFFLILTSSLIVFLFFNFSNNSNIKIFLGDGGSLFLGFIVAINLVKFTSETSLYDPSIALWMTAIIIFDFCAVIVIRKLQKREMFAADRNHIHHLLFFQGLSHFQTTALISLTAVVLLLFGVIVTTNYPSLSFWCFLALFLLYLFFRIFIRKTE